MKRNNIKQGFLSLAAACLAFTACTGDFERFNTDPNSAQEVDLKMFITTMQMDAVYSCSGSDTEPNNRYQAAYNLIGDVYAGYMSGTNNWNGGVNTQIYALNGHQLVQRTFQRVVHQCHARLAAAEVRPCQRFAQR